jgi:hypothetical protein
MSKAPAFQFYAGDFLTDVMDWTDEEVGVHIRLIAWSWVNRRGIPRDTQRLTRIAPKVMEAWPVIKEKWAEGPDDTWVNDKLESTRSNSDAFRASQRERSLLAVAARQGKPKPKGKPMGSPKDKPNGQPMGSPMGDPLEGEVEGEVLTLRKKERVHEPEIIPAGVTPAMWSAIKRWTQYRKEKKSKLTPTGMDAFVKKCVGLGEARAVAAIEHSMAQGWTGMFEPQQPRTNGNAQYSPDEKHAAVQRILDDQFAAREHP